MNTFESDLQNTINSLHNDLSDGNYSPKCDKALNIGIQNTGVHTAPTPPCPPATVQKTVSAPPKARAAAVSRDECFDAAAYAASHGRKLRITALIFGILALITFPTIILGVLFALLAILFAAISRAVTAKDCSDEQKQQLKKHGRAGYALGFTAVGLTVAWIIFLAVYFIFFADFEQTVRGIYKAIYGFEFFPDFAQGIQDFFQSIKDYWGF